MTCLWTTKNTEILESIDLCRGRSPTRRGPSGVVRVLFLEINMHMHLDGLRFRKFSVDHFSTASLSSCTCWKSLQEDIGLYIHTSSAQTTQPLSGGIVPIVLQASTPSIEAFLPLQHLLKVSLYSSVSLARRSLSCSLHLAQPLFPLVSCFLSSMFDLLAIFAIHDQVCNCF